MNNDKKTTLFGFVQSLLIALLGGFSFFSGAGAEGVINQARSAGDWGALILVGIAIVSFVKSFYTNKTDSQNQD